MIKQCIGWNWVAVCNTIDNTEQSHWIINKARIWKGAKLYKSIDMRRNTSHLVRLQIEYYSLKGYRPFFSNEDSSYRECGNSIEMVQHYLLDCSRYDRQHAKLIKNVAVGGNVDREVTGYIKPVSLPLTHSRSRKGRKSELTSLPYHGRKWKPLLAIRRLDPMNTNRACCGSYRFGITVIYGAFHDLERSGIAPKAKYRFIEF